MGLTFVDVECSANGHVAKINMLVDSGATYSVLPERVWQELGLIGTRSIRLRLADGTILRRTLSECMMEIEGERATSPTVLGGPGDMPLLGAVSLETVGLVLNPFTRTLHPMRMLLPSIAVLPGGLADED